MVTFFEDSLIVLRVCQTVMSLPKLVFRCTTALVVGDGSPQDERPQFQVREKILGEEREEGHSTPFKVL